MNNNSERWLKTFIVTLLILVMVGLIITQEQKIAVYKQILKEWGEKPFLYSILPNGNYVPEEPLQIIMEFATADGEWQKEFRPQLFLKITNTDLSRCFIDGRLRLDLNGEIYWIKLER